MSSVDPTNSNPLLEEDQRFGVSHIELTQHVFKRIGVGIIIVDKLLRIVLWNQWVENLSRISAVEAIGQQFDNVFPNLNNPRLMSGINDAIDKRMSTVLSQVFHQHPFPLYYDQGNMEKDQRISQQVSIRPLVVEREAFAFIEIKDVTASVNKEIVLKNKSLALNKVNEDFLIQRDRIQNILDSAADAIITVNTEGVISETNLSSLKIFGYSQDELLDKNLLDLIPEFNFRKALDRTQVSSFKGIAKNNRQLILEVLCSKLSKEKSSYVVTLRDVSESKKMKDAMERSEKLASVTLESITEGVISTDRNGVIDLANPIASSLLGIRRYQLLGLPVAAAFQLLNEETDEVQDNIVVRCLAEGVTVHSASNSAITNINTQEKLPIMASASPIFDSKNRVSGSVLVFRDVKEARRLSTKLSWDASHDTLTGLFNRKAFNEKLSEFINADKEGCLLFLDLDRFKLVNDTAGHSVGDQLLKQVSDLFLKFFREEDFVCRLGGDEFAILLPACPLNIARDLSEKLCLTIEQFSFPWNDRVFTIGISIGLTRFHENDESNSKILERADAACYLAKQSGRSRVHVYGESEEETEYQANIYRASEISEAITKDRFVLYKQPIVEIEGNTKKLHHYEILIRMLDETGGIIPPNEFIPAAEQFGLMQSIDKLVISKVVKYITLAREHRDVPSFAINLSGASIIDELFLNFLDKILIENLVGPECIHFEITETAAISNLGRARGFIDHFKRLGYSFALDDFGSGMSSFGYLKNLPLDYIKIDGQFVKEIVGNETDFAMVSSINYLGQMMGLRCIAEFVENDEIIEVLNKIGVDFAQGYGVERPTPLFEEGEFD